MDNAAAAGNHLLLIDVVLTEEGLFPGLARFQLLSALPLFLSAGVYARQSHALR